MGALAGQADCAAGLRSRCGASIRRSGHPSDLAPPIARPTELGSLGDFSAPKLGSLGAFSAPEIGFVRHVLAPELGSFGKSADGAGSSVGDMPINRTKRPERFSSPRRSEQTG